ncbi:MAG: hypothetical protein M1840_000932 [Geoglossum simile]|nr:MAG: hypothetical protein M1840_000932 [Geoglossum simile]
MSFGFGISDFIKLSEIAIAVVKKYRSAPDEYQTLKHEVESLGLTLGDIVLALKRLDNPEYTCKMKTTRAQCEELLKNIERFLDKHDALGVGKAPGGRLRWIASEQKGYVARVKSQNRELERVMARVQLLLTVDMHGQIVKRSQSTPTNIPTTLQISAFVPVKSMHMQYVSDNYSQYDTNYRQPSPGRKRRDGDKPTTASIRDRLAAESARSRRPSYDSQAAEPVGRRKPSYDSSFPKPYPPERTDTDITLVDEPEPLFTSPFGSSSAYPATTTPPSFPYPTPNTPRVPSLPYNYAQQPIFQGPSSNSISSQSSASSNFGSTFTSRESHMSTTSTPSSSPPQSPISQPPQIKKLRNASPTTKTESRSRSSSVKRFLNDFGTHDGLMAGVSPITDHRPPPVVKNRPLPPMPPPLRQEKVERCPEGKRRTLSRFLDTFGESKTLEKW